MGVGLAGAVLSGMLFSLAVGGTTGFVGSVMAAFVMACICIAVLRAVVIGPPRS
jgi:hypothetical protein